MPSVRRYEPAGPVLVRATSDTRVDGPAFPDLAESPTAASTQLAWLETQWSRPGLREAVTLASPDLATRVQHLLDTTTPPATKAVRRAAVTTASYLMRWQRRVTPFGLFAGVTTATVGPAGAQFGDAHTAIARADADWLTRIVDRLEADHRLRRTLTVVANNAGFVRDGRYVVAARPEPGERAPGPAREISVRHTRAVQVALACANRPVPFDRLVEQVAAQLHPGDRGKVEALLHRLVDGNLLITNLRPPMTAVDSLAHVMEALQAADDTVAPQAAAVRRQLAEIHGHLAGHNAAPTRQQGAIRAVLVESMTRVTSGPEHPLAIDLRLDAQVSVPRPVLDEAAQAANVLLRLTTQPFGTAAWLDYHTRFRTRYGPGALVPVRDLVADSGIGYPAGYLGAPRARPAWRMLTERDAYLLALIQHAVLDRADEIRLTDADIKALTVGDPATAVPPPRIELGTAVYACSTDALDRGDFELHVTGAPRAYTSMAGRFADLLDPADRARLADTYINRPAAGSDDAVAVQLSFPPRRVHNENVVRVGRLTPAVVSLSEHPDGDAISVDDLAVTADADQLYLVQVSSGRRVVPHIAHALDVIVQTPPLARFIAEVADARSAVFGPLDLGAAARTLPYTPRIRYRRTVLSPARWLLTTADLPTTVDRAGGDGWDTALRAWRQRWRVPSRVIACHGELRLPLDLDQPLDRAILRTRLARADRLELREDGPADGHRWAGRPVELLIPMTLTEPAARPLPVTAPAGRTLRAGDSPVVHAQLVGNPAQFDHLLTEHVPAMADQLGDLGVRHWWVRRHRDLIRLDADQHLAVVLRLDDPAAYGTVAAHLARFAADLHTRGLPAELVFAAYHQHPARYGHGPAWDAAEQVFAADTTAAIAQLRMADQTGIPSQVIAAASMAQLAAGFAPDPTSGYRALLTCLQQHTERADRAHGIQARDLADPGGGHRRLRALAGGESVAAAWQARSHALRAYHNSLRPQREPTGVLRTLLHEHHNRAVGVDPEFERQTGHLARAAAMRCLAQAGTR